MRCRFGRRNVTDELRDDPRADALVHQDLEVPRPHGGPLLRVYRDHALLMRGIEIIRHPVEPLDLAQRTGEHEHPQRLTGRCLELQALRRPDIDAVGRLDREPAPGERDRSATRPYEENDVTGAEAQHRRGPFLDFEQNLGLVLRAELRIHQIAVAQVAPGAHFRKSRRDHIALAIQQRPGSGTLLDRPDSAVLGTERIIERRAAGKVRMGPIAERRGSCVFTATKEHFLGSRARRELQGLEAGTLMRSVAKRLLSGATAATPEVGPAGLRGDQAWFRARNNR